MSVPLVALPVQAQTAVAATAAVPAPLGVSSPQDLEQLRAMIASTAAPAVAPAQAPAAPAAANAVGHTEFTTLGDSILDGISHFNTGYHDSMSAINSRLEHISSAGPLKLGTDFGEIMALQIEVARWSMSVMGVDNASKAGTNTIKELSRGG
ncbi:hypothetical protein [Verrucomicrobium sp. BvORR034]|jgi:hypothetical protein|uniref:hypothetical protein n=1 Tax=Verrucomicrobium sp. BvORR034 TaxID=1396418 RepID=UPI000678D40D|nr:hypothetical protein [Verrucomicrobium sp. BvORR034]